MLAYTNIPLKATKRYEKAENCILSFSPIFPRWVPLLLVKAHLALLTFFSLLLVYFINALRVSTCTCLSASFYRNHVFLLDFFFPGQRQQSVDQFLSRLPQSVIKEGKIIDVRSGVANVIKVCKGVTYKCL